MNNRHALLIPVLAAALLPSAPGTLAAEQDPRLTAVARDARAATREVTREVTRAVTRYQGSRDRNRFQQTAPLERHTVKVAPGGLIELHNIAGDITVASTGGDRATIEITKIAYGSSDADAREQLRLVQVEVIERGGGAEVRASYPEFRTRAQRRNINVSTAYRVVAPAGTRIRTDSVSGNVAVTGIRGDLALGTISGNVVVRDAGRRVSAQSISGNVELVSAQEDAVVELSSTSGNVTARRLSVRRVEMGSVSGSIHASELQCETAALHTMSGNVEYSGSLTAGGRYEFRTHSGDVRLIFAQGVGFELEASTYSGEVRTGLPLRMEGQTRGRHRTVRGTHGDGRARVEASSFSGNIQINGR